MSNALLLERRKWFRVFPEGTLEFMMITRVFALIFLVALAVVSGAQRPFVLMGLAAVLWADYALLAWWMVQVALDLRVVVSGPSSDDTPARRARTGVLVLLPSVMLTASILPWSLALGLVGIRSAWVAGIVPAAAAVLFVLALIPAYRTLRGLQLGSALWTFLMLVPIVHFFASHRLAAGLDEGIREQLRARGERPQVLHKPTVALLIADVTWVLSVLPWIVVIAVSLARGWNESGLFKAGPVCGTMIAALFAIANLAAMEAVQRHLVLLVRKPQATT